jgi:hypothetical protein
MSLTFVEGQKVHLYIKGYDQFNATVTKIGQDKKNPKFQTVSVSYKEGTLEDLQMSNMYAGTNNDPVYTEHPGIKDKGEEVRALSPTAPSH